MTQAATTEVVDTNWMERARCRSFDPEQFFVRGAAQSKRAVRICERCDVRDACRRYAVANEIEYGVWGGLTERQRRKLIREARELAVAASRPVLATA